MSGGSFNYLCHKDIDDIAHGVGEEWDWMLRELKAIDASDIAVEMEVIRLGTNKFTSEHAVRWDRLRPVLKAIEWFRSSDWGFEPVLEQIKIWREKQEDDVSADRYIMKTRPDEFAILDSASDGREVATTSDYQDALTVVNALNFNDSPSIYGYYLRPDEDE